MSDEVFETAEAPALTSYVATHCRMCKKPVTVMVPAAGQFFHEEMARLARLMAVHDHCMDGKIGRERAAILHARAKERMASWHAMCPEEFRKAIDWKRTKGAGKHYKTIMEWKPGAPGWRLQGVSGHCKTRFMFKLFEREYNTGRKLGVWTHTKLRETLSALAATDSQRFLRFIDELSQLEMLCIDDFGKGKSTPASEEGLFHLIDNRYRNNVATFYTMNGEIEQLVLSMGEEYREPLLRRIEETTALLTL